MKREENELMREKILDAVIACKNAASGAEVSLSQISCRAEISERTLNRYFPDKEMLLYDAAIRHLQSIYDAFSERYLAVDKSGMNGLQCLLLMIQMQIDNNRANPYNAKVFVRAYTVALRTAIYQDLPVAGYDASVQKIAIQCIQDGIKDGSIRHDVVPSDAYLLISSNYIGLVQRLIYLYSVEQSEQEHKEMLFQVFHKYLHMLEAYLGTKQRYFFANHQSPLVVSAIRQGLSWTKMSDDRHVTKAHSTNANRAV